MDIPSEHNQEPDVNLEPESAQAEKKRKKHSKMECFSCNRPEVHSLVVRKRWFFSYLLGLTLGLSVVVGPYFCVCCGSKRWMWNNFLNPRFWLRKYRNQKLSARN